VALIGVNGPRPASAGRGAAGEIVAPAAAGDEEAGPADGAAQAGRAVRLPAAAD
jgi:hypothetical protein